MDRGDIRTVGFLVGVLLIAIASSITWGLAGGLGSVGVCLVVSILRG